MLYTPCPRTAAWATRTRRAHTWGNFAFRTAERRICGLRASASCYALAAFSGRFGLFTPYPGCSAARNSFSPVQARPQPVALALCHFCQSAIDEASRCACFGSAHA